MDPSPQQRGPQQGRPRPDGPGQSSPPQPTPQQLSPERLSPQQLPPAIVTFLLQGGKVTTPVFSRALLSLAEDGWLRIEPQDSGSVPHVQIARMPAPNEIRPFEQLAIERVVRRMGTLTHVPLSALTDGEGEGYDAWWRQFGKAVTAEAVQAGVYSDELSRSSCVVSLLLAVTTAIVLAATSKLAAGALFGIGFAVFVVGMFVVSAASRPKLTESGIAAAGWWRQHGSGLGGAVIADRLPPGAQPPPQPQSTEAVIAHGTAPLPEGHVWSAYGGRWRTVKVGSPDVSTWGKPDGAALLGCLGIVFTAVLGFGGSFLGNGIGVLLGLVPLTVFGGVLFFSWLPANRRARTIPQRSTFPGQVVRRWEHSDSDDSTTYYCCVDDGASPEARSFRIEHSLYKRIHVGDVVYVDYNPRWHSVNGIQITAPAPRD